MRRRAVILSIGMTLVAGDVWAAEVTAGSGLSAVKRTSTGIYQLATLHNPKTKGQYSTLALFCQGQAKDVHARRTGTRYLRRAEGSTPIRVSTSKFTELLAIVPANQDVETRPAAVRDRYRAIACGSGGAAPPPAKVAPGPGKTCPPGYELKLEGVPKHFACRPLSQAPSSPAPSWVVRWWDRLEVVPSAEAYMDRFVFELANFGSPIAFQFHEHYGGTDVMAWEFKGFGFEIRYIDMPGSAGY